MFEPISIFVQEKRSHRAGLYGLFLALLLCQGLCILVSPYLGVGFLFLFFGPMSAVLHCRLSWSIHLSYYHIDSTAYTWYLKRRCTRHTYVQIQDLRMSALPSERVPCLVITFTDGEVLRMRMDCQNAEQAKRYLLSRHSIR